MNRKWLINVSVLSITLLLSLISINLFKDKKLTYSTYSPSISPSPTFGNPILSSSPLPIKTMTPKSDFEPSPSPEINSNEEVINMNSSFYQSEISDKLYKRIQNKSYKKDCTIKLKDLRYIEVLHYGFDDKVHKGELIVNKNIADDIINIFKELYIEKYPIEKIILIDEYDADDNQSMADNNSSSFNFRVIDGTSRLSNHASGFAIDINPLYNPYVRNINGKIIIQPENAKKYTDRSKDCLYYIKKDDICYKTFKKYGFEWGGEWKSSKDYQHFQKIF